MATERWWSALHDITPSERWHLDHPGELSPLYSDTALIPRVDTPQGTVYLFDWQRERKEHAIALIKESRFTYIPAHTNRDMSLSFIYEGSCDFVVDNEKLHLSEGDLILFDSDVVCSSPSVKGQNDIVISMVFAPKLFDSVFLSQLPGQGILTNMLFEYISERRRKDCYLYLPAAYTGNIRMQLELIASEYFEEEIYRDELISSYVVSLFVQMIRGLYYKTQDLGEVARPGARVHEILNYIEHNYPVCTLASVAAQFGYNPTYLGNLIKRTTGRTFSSIRVGQQIAEAAYLLLNTDRTIVQIAHKVGITNMSYFYSKFSERYHMSPKAYREQLV